MARHFNTGGERVRHSREYYTPTSKLPALKTVPCPFKQGVYLLLESNNKVIVAQIQVKGQTIHLLNSDLTGTTPELLGILIPEITFGLRGKIIVTKIPEILSMEVCRFEALKEMKTAKNDRIKASLLRKIDKINRLETGVSYHDQTILEVRIGQNADRMDLYTNRRGVYCGRGSSFPSRNSGFIFTPNYNRGLNSISTLETTSS
jgi:hypothetical protein